MKGSIKQRKKESCSSWSLPLISLPLYALFICLILVVILPFPCEAGPKHGPKNIGHSSSLSGERVGDAWVVSHQKGIMKGQSLTFQFIEHPTNKMHSCYRVTCTGTHCGDNQTAVMEMCYPAVIVTGLPKCGTSAMYDLLAKFPDAITMHEKENCPYTRRRTHWQYFNSFPAFSALKENSLIIDGCIDVINNMKMRETLHNPQTYYIVMIRDYADMIWSSYNFWCKVGYDDKGCGYERWASKEFHKRSPEIFHHLIVSDQEGNSSVVQPFYYPMHRPCINAGGYYTEYIDFHIRNYVTEDHYIIIASEELEINPYQVAKRIADRISYRYTELDLKNFTKVRINSQENKGSSHSVSLDTYKPGVYAISDYRPMLEETRTLLNKCWYDDCLKIAQRTNYSYTACMSNEKHAQRQAEIKVDSIYNHAKARLYIPATLALPET